MKFSTVSGDSVMEKGDRCEIFDAYNLESSSFIDSTDRLLSQGHDKVFVQTLIYAALPEFYAILGLVGALMA